MRKLSNILRFLISPVVILYFLLKGLQGEFWKAFMQWYSGEKKDKYKGQEYRRAINRRSK